MVGPRGDRRAVHAHAGADRRGAWTNPIDYIAVGPGVRHSHQGHRLRRGRADDWYAAVRGLARARGLPVVAIGGITLDNAPSVIEAGAASVAVITDLLKARSARARARRVSARLLRLPL